MYVVQVVQSGSGRLTASFGNGRQHTPAHSNTRNTRNCSAEACHGREALNHEASTPDALSCQPTTTAVRPWLRQIAVLMRPLEQQQQPQRLPAVVARCSPPDSSISVLSAAPSSTASWPAGGLDGPDPLVIHLPGADGTSESSPADPASAGLPASPPVVTDSNSLALRDPAAVQYRQQDQLGFRPDSGSKTLSTMLPRSPSTLQSRAAAEAPATRALGPTGLQARPAGPLGFLPPLQWSNTTMYWGSPIGGTLYINPPVDEPAAAAASGATASSKQRPSRAHRQFWGSPIGGTLYINPPVEEGPTPSTPQQDTSAPSRQHSSSNVFWGSPIGGTLYINPHVDDSLGHSSAGQLATGRPQAAVGAAAAAAAAAAASSSTASPGSTKSRHSRLPFPLFQWGSSNTAQWGAPIGGTLYINPQAPADWHEGSWGSGSSGFGSGSGGPGSGSNGGGNGAGAGSGSRGGSSSGIGGNGVTSKQRNTVYASARAGQAAWGGVPPGVGLAKLGVGLMAAVAAAAMAVYLRAATGSTSSNTTSTYSTSAAQHDAETPSAAAAGSAVDVSAARAAGRASVPAAAAAEDAPEGPGFHQWMVQRLQSTLDAFEAEQSLLRTELAVLNSLPVAKKGMLGGLQDLTRWLSRGAGGAAGGASSSSSSNITSDGPAALSEAAAVASAVQGGTTKAGALSAAEVANRVAEIQEQLESIDVLKAALTAEMGEQQQLLQKAQQEQQVAQDQFRALVGR